MFKFTILSKKSENSGTLRKLLVGIVNTSLSSIEVGIRTSEIRKSSKKIHDLVSSTASASEEMASTVQGIAQNAQTANETASVVRQESQDAATVMEKISGDMRLTTTSMEELRQASEEIQHIVSSIEDISDQTNLLALNAAIEAARAGDAGRGFAVVADEVRKLSNQSQEATAQIATTIQKIQQDIVNVVEAVSQASSSVDSGSERVSGLMASAQDIETLMRSIAESTREQSDASQQISESIYKVSEEANENESKTAQIMIMIDELTQIVEEQRTMLAEQDIPGKVIVLAQADHALWKKKIIDFEMGRIDLHEDSVGDHKSCRLGKWYYAEGKDKYGSEASFKNMEDPHVRVHKAARIAAERRHKDPGADISDLVNDLQEASVEVIEQLNQLSKK